jgi:NAD(P)-dependent dehydrogenase (short-subunit alcohol dehydrogenase family)
MLYFHSSIHRVLTVYMQFNNAGIMHPEDDNALNTEEKIWDLTMQINLTGVWWGCTYAIIAMRQNPVDESKGLQTGGSIINTASFVAIMGAATPQLACEPFRFL